MFSYLSKINEVQSSIPSCMKHVSTLDVKTDGSLKVKRRTLVLTSHGDNANLKEKTKEEEQASFNHITV